MSKRPDPYASEEDTRALLRKDTRTPAERKLDRMLEDRGASEQGAEPFLILRQITLEMLAEQPAQPQQEPVAERLMDCDDCGGTGVDGDVDDRGLTFDVQCRSCAGSGKSRYLGRCANGRRCLQGCLSTDGCYWEKRAAKEQPAQQEPVAWLTGCPSCGMDSCDCDEGTWNPPAQQEPLTDEQRTSLRDAFAQALTSVYVCGRVWEAWQYGTMSEGDFQPAGECEEVLDSLIEAAHGIGEKK